MTAAEQQLGQRKADDALGPEQRALAHLQRAEEAFREVQVSQGQQQGGGGQQSNAEAEDLADLFELETDKLQNQYETMERGEERQRQRELDETLERLKQLAARQQQQAGDARRGTGRRRTQGGGQQQRADRAPGTVRFGAAPAGAGSGGARTTAREAHARAAESRGRRGGAPAAGGGERDEALGRVAERR